MKKNFKKAAIYVDIPYYANKSNLIIEARIDKDPSWTLISNERTFIIDKIEPGNHNFEIRVLANDYGKYIYHSIALYVQPHFYQTIWFRFFITFSVLAAIGYLIKSILKKLTRKVCQQQMKIKSIKEKLSKVEDRLKNETISQEELFQAIIHDIATPIKHLSNLSKLMVTNNNSELQKKYFDRISQSTQELYNFTMTFREYLELFKLHTN